MKYFGTDGIRGEVGTGPITEEFFAQLGHVWAQRLREKFPHKPLQVVVGRDTRASGQALVGAFTAAMSSHGVQVYDLGVVPTPAVAMMVRSLLADLGVAVTASHNPVRDNGIKFFDEEGFKFSEEVEAEVEAALLTNPQAGHQQVERMAYDALSVFVDKQKSVVPAGLLKGKKLVVDLANGATYQSTVQILRGLGAELVVMGGEPDGYNINVDCGSEHPHGLAARVLAEGAWAGVAHDGDGDRMVLCDELGSIVDGDEVLGMLALALLLGDDGVEKTLVATVQSNRGLAASLAKWGIAVEVVDVGDRNVSRRMRELQARVGGESSGHIVLSDYLPTGDGIVAVLKVLAYMVKQDQPLSQLRRQIELFPQATRNLRVAEKLPLADLPRVQQVLAEIEAVVAGQGRSLLRYSGTEAKIRLLVEAKTLELAEELLDKLVEAVKNDLIVT